MRQRCSRATDAAHEAATRHTGMYWGASYVQASFWTRCKQQQPASERARVTLVRKHNIYRDAARAHSNASVT